MFGSHSPCILWLWLLPLICNGTIQFSSFTVSSGVQEGDLRLAGSTRQSEGRVEIYHDGQWGTVCDDGWDLKEARVVCRQLKFPGAKSVVTGELYGKASGPIWMDDTECSGTEKYLQSCKFKGWGNTDCNHKEDVGVVCETAAEGSFENSSYILDHRIVLSDELGELFDRGRFCDISITAKSSSPDSPTETMQTDITVCAHKAILSHVEAFNITENTRNITVQVVQRCLPHFSSFIRYLYTRKIEATYSSVQCLHWLSSKFRVEQLMRDSSLLFKQILPDDGSFDTPLSVHEYAVETNDLVLQDICAQYLAWNFQNFSQAPAWTHISVDLLTSLLVRSDLVVPEEMFVLRAVENWILNNVNITSNTLARVFSLVRFPMIPAEQLTKGHMLLNSSLYSRYAAILDENMLKALQFNVQLFASLKSRQKTLVDDVCYQPRIYTAPRWSVVFPTLDRTHYNQGKYIQAPYHSSLIFQNTQMGWEANIFSNQYQCSNRGTRCQSLPMARLVNYNSNSQPGVVFHNRLLLQCDGRFISHVHDFKNNVVALGNNSTESLTYPCRSSEYKYIFVVRPEFI